MSLQVIRVVLPLPNTLLSPNARPNVYAKAGVTRQARTKAKRETYLLFSELDFPFGYRVIGLRYVAYWKTAARHDDTNLIASCKAYEDGISDAIGQDDSEWEIRKPVHKKSSKNPRLVVKVLVKEY